MKITVFGSELNGLVTAGCLAKEGNHVLLVAMDDSSENHTVELSLTQAEPGLTFLLSSQIIEKKLVYTTDWDKAIDHADVIFINTSSWLLDHAEKIIVRIAEVATKEVIVVNQTTFSVGKAKQFEQKICVGLKQRGCQFLASVLSMPEFVRRGTAIDDFTNPDRIVLGGNNTRSLAILSKLMKPFYKADTGLKIMQSQAAEYTKLSLNAILATRISLINELANNAEKFGIDFAEVREGIGSDSRIGFNYIDPGCGFGGPSFASDMNTLVSAFEEKGTDGGLLKTALAENEIQKEILFRKAWRFFNSQLSGKRFAVWGLSFKANTETVKNAPSLILVDLLLSQGANVSVYDPKANNSFIENFEQTNSVIIADNKYEILAGVDALFILTDWDEFLKADLKKMTSLMKEKIIFDGRNIFEPKQMKERGITYIGIGRGEVI